MTKLTTSRREFVASTSQALAGLTLANGWGGTFRLFPMSLTGRRGKTSAAALFPGDMGSLDLKALAKQALDAASSSGASYADIRLAEWYYLELNTDMGPAVGVRLYSNFSYGIRVIADGARAFIHGCLPEGDSIVTAAKDAVATAKGYAAVAPAHVDLAPTPVAQGEWSTPIHGDPFVMPLQDQCDLLCSYEDVGNRIVERSVLEGGVSLVLRWTKEHRVYGSTAGSLAAQTLFRSNPQFSVGGSRTYLPSTEAYLPNLLVPMAGGFETVSNPAIPDQLKSAMERVVAVSQMPPRRFDVGRFPVVVDGSVLGTLFGKTVGVGLELDRALGYEGDAGGTTFISPPAQMLGKMVIHPLLNATATRALPHVQAVKWDDEGVEPEDYQVLKDGVVVDYHTSRQAAPALAEWYQSQGKPLRSHGCAVAEEAGDPVTVQMPHMAVAPVRESTSLDDLCKGIARGLLVTQRPYVSVDQQLSGGAVFSQEMFEISHGKVVGRVKDAGLQFSTTALWKSLRALGGPSTVCDTNYEVSKGIPWHSSLQTTSAPAGLFAEVNVVDTGRKL